MSSMIERGTLLRWLLEKRGEFAPGPVPERKAKAGVEVAPYPKVARAAVCISADFELMWAWRGRSYAAEKAKAGRENVPMILEILEDVGVPVTWATVGHLFLESCERDCHGVAHADMPRPTVNWRWDGDWYMQDPCSNWERDPDWYAPDLVSKILASPVPHEIGTHTFSHIRCSREHASRELISREIEESCAAMAPFRLRPRSLIYPYNVMGHSFQDVLKELGITAVRHRDRIRLGYPERMESGVYRIYESMNNRSPWYYDYPTRARIYIQEAMKRHAVYHFWFHPSDPRSVFRGAFRKIVAYVGRLAGAGLVWAATMQEIVAYCEARRAVQFEVIRDPKFVEIRLDFGAYDEGRYGGAELTFWIDAGDEVASVRGSTGEREFSVPHTVSSDRKVVVQAPLSTRVIRVENCRYSVVG